MRRVILGVFAGVVVAVLFVVLCTYVRRPYEKILLSRFGTLIDAPGQSRIGYNWYLKWPTDSVIRFDSRLHLYTSPLQQLTMAQSVTISVRTFAAWRIVDPQKFQYTFGGSDERAQSTMQSILMGLVPTAIGNHQLDELFNADEAKIHTADIEKKLAKDATEGGYKLPNGKVVVGLREMGIEVVEVGFSRMAFPPANAEKVYERMVAELNKQAMTYQAEGLAEANRILAEGKQAAAKERADALAEAQLIQGQGDAEALRILSSVQQDDKTREFYQYWKSLDFLKTTLRLNTVLVLSSNSDLLKALFSAPGNARSILPVNPAEAIKVVPVAPGK